jgi:hypothetical protein
MNDRLNVTQLRDLLNSAEKLGWGEGEVVFRDTENTIGLGAMVDGEYNEIIYVVKENPITEGESA